MTTLSERLAPKYTRNDGHVRKLRDLLHRIYRQQIDLCCPECGAAMRRNSGRYVRRRGHCQDCREIRVLMAEIEAFGLDVKDKP